MLTFLGFKSCKFLVILKALWPYLWNSNKKVRYKLIGSVVFNILAIISSISTPVLFGRMIDSFSSSHSSSFSHSWFLTSLIAYVGVWSFSKVFLYLREIMMFPVMEKAIRLLAFHLFQHIQLLPFHYHLKRKTGEVTGVMETAI